MKKIGMILVLTGVMGLVGLLYAGRQRGEELQVSIAEKVLRFHVIADSDSQEDQELKLKVRDAVGTYVQSKINKSDDLDATVDIINKEMEHIICIAENTIREQGSEKMVHACVTNTVFPEKTYGDFIFPAGQYRALEITIGSGKGRNWWCVLYPNLCFRGTMFEAVGSEAEEELREVLSPEEYREVLRKGNYKVRIKLFGHDLSF